MAMGPALHGTKNDCAGEDQQQFTRNLRVHHRWMVTQTITSLDIHNIVLSAYFWYSHAGEELIDPYVGLFFRKIA
jgi:hypothetical protein